MREPTGSTALILSLRAAESRAASAEAEVEKLRTRLEINHAYDTAGNPRPFPAGMEHWDGIACRDETIKGLEGVASDLRDRVAVLEKAVSLLLPFVDFAAGEGIGYLPAPDDPEMDAADICTATAKALGIELGGPEYMALIATGNAARAALKESTHV